jgi:hypothetical protein
MAGREQGERPSQDNQSEIRAFARSIREKNLYAERRRSRKGLALSTGLLAGTTAFAAY